MNRYLLSGVAVVGLLCAGGAAQAQDWSGVYVGGNLTYTDTDTNAEFVNPALSAFDPNSNPTGLSVGAQFGVMQQFDMFVLGIEGSVNVGDVSVTVTDPYVGSPDTVTNTSDFSVTVLGRAGVALGNFLPYVVGGYVGSHITTSATSGNLSDDGFFSGWAVGAGFQLALDDHWSAGLQYLHTDIADVNFYEGAGYETTANPISNSFTMNFNYRF